MAKEKSLFYKLFNPHIDNSGDILLKKENTLRKLVGILGMTLPLFLYLFLFIDSGFTSVLPSISHYYYTRACSVFIITVSILAIFLIIYKGNSKRGYYISTISGIAAILLLLFPTDNLFPKLHGIYYKVSVTCLKDSPFRTYFHYIQSAIFLLGLAYMSYFLFPEKTGIDLKHNKLMGVRNIIFRTTAIIMAIALLIIFLGSFNLFNCNFYLTNSITFWMEVICLESFGISWMVKGEFILKTNLNPLE